MGFIKEGEENIQKKTEIWKLTNNELKERIGNFEKQLITHRDNVPPTREGKRRAVLDGKLPDVGMWWLEDRGICSWYVQNGWLYTEKKPGEKRSWAMTEKFDRDGIAEIEVALDELQHRRASAEEEAIKGGDPEIAEMYYKEKREKIATLRKILMAKLCKV